MTDTDETQVQAEVDTPDATEPEAAAPATPTAGAILTGANKPGLPDGVVSPITARNHLVQKGHAPDTLKPQQMYGFVKAPGKGENRFPVKHYDGKGGAFDEPQIDENGTVLTRPGVIIDEVIAWWEKRKVTQGEKAAAKAAKARADAEKKKAEAETASATPADSAPAQESAEAADDGSEMVQSEAE